ncbi:hypothetical protein MKUB_45600 [Mycobacterium kubicae]|uniref:Two-component sensor histidine kinase n=1 Tax=Mycobacterium kubicae TaxID=120959 RepID=A0ABQ1BTL2_9MYCO|nr:hypothetical protein MKUB_45600 [Mycobacterium kubicae]
MLIGVLAVVTVVLVAVGAVSVLSLRGYVTAMNDAEVAESMHAFSHAYARYRNGEHTSLHPGDPPVAQALLEFTGQTPGNLIAVLRDGVVIGSAVFSEDEPQPAPPDVIRAIEAQSWTDGPSRIETLGSLGPHQVDSRAAGSDRLIVGVSLTLADQIIARKQITTTALVATALVITEHSPSGWSGSRFVRCAGWPPPPPKSPRCHLPATTTRSVCVCGPKTPTRTTKSGSSGTP